jgi:hypothetical protein
MKKIMIIALFLLNSIGFAQIKGNKNIVTKTFDLDKIEVVKINLYAKVTIDCNLENKITIKTDENLLKHIDKNVKNGILSLNQLKWIRASQKIEITIGAPFLKEIETGTHEITVLENFKNKSLKIIAKIGNIKVSGKTENLIIYAKNGTVNAANLKTENAFVNITGDSKTNIFVLNELETKLSENARLKLLNTPKKIIGNLNNKKSFANTDLKWINITLKNNSWNRHKLVVVGPKKDGSTFSYGFAMMPKTTKKERWTVGSKIYKSTSLGAKKLLATVTKENENNLIKLFKN